MVRKRFTETPVEEFTEEAEKENDEPVPEESNVEEESQIEQLPVKPKTIKQLQKEAEKRAREQVKLDMKVKVKCPVCRRTMSQHCLLYTHKCAKANLEKLPKQTGVKEIEQELEDSIPREENPKSSSSPRSSSAPVEPPSPEWQEVKKRFAPNPDPKFANMYQIRLHWFDTTTGTHITTSFHRCLARRCTSS